LTPPAALDTPRRTTTAAPDAAAQHFLQKKRGSRSFATAAGTAVSIYWDTAEAKYPAGPAPEPSRDYYLAVVADGELALLLGGGGGGGGGGRGGGGGGGAGVGGEEEAPALEVGGEEEAAAAALGSGERRKRRWRRSGSGRGEGGARVGRWEAESVSLFSALNLSDLVISAVGK
jgi:hypothetical protein